MEKRFLIGCMANEVRNGRLNGSHPDLEKGVGSTTKNIAFTKKISRGRDRYPYASGQHTKFNFKRIAELNGQTISDVIHSEKDSQQASTEGHPYKNYDEDVFGFMNADKLTLSEEEFIELPDEQKVGFTSKTKGKGKKEKTIYEKNVTKKRKARLMVTPLQAIGPTRIQREFCVKATDKTNLLYEKEIYSAIMSMGFNLDINEVGRFRVSEDSSGFRDYAPFELEAFGLKADEDGIIDIGKEERLKRIKDTLKAIQFYNSTACQNNNLEDLNAKFVILAEYRIGNNIFNNVFRNNSLDIEYLKEAIRENEEFRLSDIYIGVRAGFMQVSSEDGEKKDLRELLKEKLSDLKYVKVTDIKKAFEGYIEHASKTLS